MDSVPRVAHSDQPALALVSPVATGAKESVGEPADDPYSPGPQPLSYLLGVLIALATAIVPIATVVGGGSLESSPTTLNEPTSSAGSPSAGSPSVEPAISPVSAAAAGEIPRSPGPGTPWLDRQSQPR
jgi:hypothetical protein